MDGLKCLRCGHEWLPRKTDGKLPIQCPGCKSLKWNDKKEEVKND